LNDARRRARAQRTKQAADRYYSTASKNDSISATSSSGASSGM
jgi:hypothetical protein